MSEYAVKINDIVKVYRLYDKPVDRLKEALNPTRKSYHKDFYALRNISFDIRRGETIGIIGKNGSGKSTLLKILTGVLTPTSGAFEINGRISALLELGAGFNPQYTGIENIYLNGTVMGYTRAEIDTKVDNIVQFADIGDFINQPVRNYSSGMFARLAFAVAINVDPDILIVDEALSVGDIYFQSKCYKKFDDFKKAGKTILFVSHDLNSIIKYCDETVLINDGNYIAKGPSNEIVDIYKKILANQPLTTQEKSGASSEKYVDETAKKNKVEWRSRLPVNPNLLKYGNGGAEIIDFAIQNDMGKITNGIEKGTKFSIVMKVKFAENIADPIFAFTIKDRKGTEVTGTNTLYERVNVPVGKRGKTVTVKFEQVMHLNGGQYLLSLGCTKYGNDGLIVFDRLYDVCGIDVLSAKDTLGFFDMDSVISIT